MIIIFLLFSYLNLVFSSNEELIIPCPNDFIQSSLWTLSHLEPCHNNHINLFIEDPWSQSIMHTCGSESKGSLPNTCSDIRFQSLAIDNIHSHIFISSNLAIIKGNLNIIDVENSENNYHITSPENNAKSIIGGYVIINIYGYNFGKSINDIIIKIKDKTCGTMSYYNNSFISCIIGNPELLLSPITDDSISVIVIGSGQFNKVIPQVMAKARLAAGYQQPLVYKADVIDKGFRPSALTVYPGESTTTTAASASSGGRIFWYNRASGSLQSSNLQGEDLFEHATGLGRIADIKIDFSGKYLFVSNQLDRNILVYDVSMSNKVSKSPYVVVDNLHEPWGLVLDEINGFLFVAESGKNRLLRYDGLNNFLSILKQSSSSTATSAATSMQPLKKYKSIVSVHTGVQLTDISLLQQSNTSSLASSLNNKNQYRTPAIFDMKQKFIWNEINGDKIKLSTIHGTRIENIKSLPNQITQNYENTLIWPKTLIYDNRLPNKYLNNSYDIFYVAEYLGKIWELSSSDKKHAKLIMDLSNFKSSDELSSSLTSPSSSSNLRTFIESIGRNGDYLKGQARSGSILRVSA
jgi:hypothetical protein